VADSGAREELARAVGMSVSSYPRLAFVL